MAETETDIKVTNPSAIWSVIAHRDLFSWACHTWTPASKYQESEMLAGIQTKEGWDNTGIPCLPLYLVMQLDYIHGKSLDIFLQFSLFYF